MALLLLCALPVPTGSADHDYGHRYMVYGRVLDASGEPAGQVTVRVVVETIKTQDPYITVQTDCDGLYYTLKDRTDTEGAYGEATDWGVSDDKLYIREAEFKDNGRFHVYVHHDGDEVFHGSWPLDATVQRSVRNIRLDTEVPVADGCASDWDRNYIVTGRIQTEAGREDGSARHDAMSTDEEDHTVQVSIETTDGPRKMSVRTNEVGDYFAVFQDVSVRDGDRITVRYHETDERGSVDTTFRLTAVDVFVAQPAVSKTTLTILLVVAGLMLFGGIAIWRFAQRKRTAESDDRS